MPAKLIPLQQWAKATYGDAAPSIGTLRRWARDNRLSPPAEKHGREYFVSPDAHYAANDAEKPENVRPVRERAATQSSESASELMKRIIHGCKAKAA